MSWVASQPRREVGYDPEGLGAEPWGGRGEEQCRGPRGREERAGG